MIVRSSSYTSAQKHELTRPMFYETNLPGLLNVVVGSLLGFKGAKTIYQVNTEVNQLGSAIWSAHREKITNATINLIQAPLLVIEAVCSIALNALRFLHSASPVVGPLAHAASGLGGIICAIETLFESIELHRTVQFYQTIQPTRLRTWVKLSQLNQEQAVAVVAKRLTHTLANPTAYASQSHLRPVQRHWKRLLSYQALSQRQFRRKHERIYKRLMKLETQHIVSSLQVISQKYLNVTPSQHKEINKFCHVYAVNHRKEVSQVFLRENMNVLSGRIQPWAAAELKKKLPALLTTLQTTKSRDHKKRVQARKEAINLMSNLHTQTHKRMVAHALAYTAIACTVIGIGLAVASLSPHIFLPLVISGVTFSILRSLFIQGVCTAKGWHIEWHQFIPDALKLEAFKQRHETITSNTKRIGMVALRALFAVGTVALHALRRIG